MTALLQLGTPEAGFGGAVIIGLFGFLTVGLRMVGAHLKGLTEEQKQERDQYRAIIQEQVVSDREASAQLSVALTREHERMLAVLHEMQISLARMNGRDKGGTL